MADKTKKVVNDIARPGKSAPSATSRPIIVGHGPMLSDPMVHEEETAKDQESTPAPSAGHKVVEPATLKPDAPADKPVQAQEASPQTPPEEADPAADSSESAVVDAVADQAKDKKKADEAEKAETEKQARLEQLITDKKYFVPIGMSHRKRSNALGIVLLIVLALAVGVAAVLYQQGRIALP